MKSSKQFVIDRILDQARIGNVPLTDIELRMLKFTEASSESKDIEAAEVFERDYNDEEYEEKIAKLIRHAYARDKEAGNQEAWDNALVRVAGRDLYLNVMIDRAGIDGDPDGFFGGWRFFLYAVSPWAISLAAAVLIGFSPFGSRLIRSDALRLLLTICIFASPYVLLRSSKPRRKRAAKRSRNAKLDRSSR